MSSLDLFESALDLARGSDNVAEQLPIDLSVTTLSQPKLLLVRLMARDIPYFIKRHRLEQTSLRIVRPEVPGSTGLSYKYATANSPNGVQVEFLSRCGETGAVCRIAQYITPPSVDAASLRDSWIGGYFLPPDTIANACVTRNYISQESTDSFFGVAVQPSIDEATVHSIGQHFDLENADFCDTALVDAWTRWYPAQANNTRAALIDLLEDLCAHFHLTTAVFTKACDLLDRFCKVDASEVLSKRTVKIIVLTVLALACKFIDHRPVSVHALVTVMEQWGGDTKIPTPTEFAYWEVRVLETLQFNLHEPTLMDLVIHRVANQHLEQESSLDFCASTLEAFCIASNICNRQLNLAARSHAAIASAIMESALGAPPENSPAANVLSLCRNFCRDAAAASGKTPFPRPCHCSPSGLHRFESIFHRPLL